MCWVRWRVGAERTLGGLLDQCEDHRGDEADGEEQARPRQQLFGSHVAAPLLSGRERSRRVGHPER